LKTINPIRILDGGHHFNEVVFDDVVVPGDMLLGEEGNGWHQVTSGSYVAADNIFEPDVYAVQGYDAAQLLDIGLKAVKGDLKAGKALVAAMEGVTIDSPRGKWKMSKAHNPIQDSYLRQVVGEQNKYVSVAWKALEDPARGCKMA